MRNQGPADVGASRVGASLRGRVTDRVEAFAFDHLPIRVLVWITRSRCARRRAAVRADLRRGEPSRG